jgi:hypothetical protein
MVSHWFGFHGVIHVVAVVGAQSAEHDLDGKPGQTVQQGGQFRAESVTPGAHRISDINEVGHRHALSKVKVTEV